VEKAGDVQLLDVGGGRRRATARISAVRATCRECWKVGRLRCSMVVARVRTVALKSATLF